jgi:hypothetical protein
MAEQTQNTKAGWEVKAIRDLDLATVYCDQSTTLVSLAHRAVIAEFEGEQAQQGVPHLYLTSEIEVAAARECGYPDASEDDGFPGWDVIFDYVKAHRECLSVDHYTAEVAEAVRKAASGGGDGPR